MTKLKKLTNDEQVYQYYRQNWNLFAKELLGVKLDAEQRRILQAIQQQRRVSVRSGHSRGKDFVAAVAAVCFLYLQIPSKVIIIAPTQRQVDQILMPEITKIHKKANFPLGGEVLTNRVKTCLKEWYLLAFCTQDYRHEVWTGYHSLNILVVVSEASGINDLVYEDIEGILTGNSRLLLVFNPHKTSGVAYQSTRNPLYKHFHLNSLHAPNVKAGRLIYPGQVDCEWIEDMLLNHCMLIEDAAAYRADHEDGASLFQWQGNWYLPDDNFRVRVMGEFPLKDTDQLIPVNFVEKANQLWTPAYKNVEKVPLRLGVDVAGMGTDKTVLVYRYSNRVTQIETLVQNDLMALAGKIKTILDANPGSKAFIDIIGVGAGVYSRLKELKVAVYGVNFAEKACDCRKQDLTDVTKQRAFENMRAFCWWAVRDALDPQNDIKLLLPPHEGLKQDLTEPRWEFTSSGRLKIESKDEIRKRLKRSTDFGDALALTYYPEEQIQPVAHIAFASIVREPSTWGHGWISSWENYRLRGRF